MHKKLLLPFIIAIILFSMAVTNMALWLIVSSNNLITHDQAVTEYLGYFPDYMANVHLNTIFNIVAGAVAGFIFYKTKEHKPYKITSMFLGALCLVIILWNLILLF